MTDYYKLYKKIINIFIKGTVTHGCVDTRGSIYNYTWYCLILDGQF
jgi:hypothetical protein